MKNIIIGFVAIGVFGAFLMTYFLLGPKKQTSYSTENVPATPTETLLKVDEEANASGEDEAETLKVRVKQALIEEHGQSSETLNISVSKVEGNYAQGGASEPEMGGGMWFAAKVDGKWELVWDGNGIIECESVNAYPEFPASMIPECFDTSSQELIKR